jgi:hypothetical protein
VVTPPQASGGELTPTLGQELLEAQQDARVHLADA